LDNALAELFFATYKLDLIELATCGAVSVSLDTGQEGAERCQRAR
jgi:hypothetical protein